MAHADRGWRETVTRLDASTVLMVVAIAVGLIVRWRFGLGSKAAFDSDESITGLTARAALHGKWVALYPGQQYGGTLGVVPVVVAQWLLGPTFVALRLAAFAESLVIWGLLYFVARRAGVSGRIALILASVWPLALVAFSVREMLFYNIALILGCLSWLLAQSVPSDDWRDLVRVLLIGVISGFAAWTTPQCASLVVPCVVMFAYRRRRVGRRALGAVALVAAGLIAGLPWLIRNMHTGFASLQTSRLISNPEPFAWRVVVSVRAAIFVPFGDVNHPVRDLLPNNVPTLVLGAIFVVMLVLAIHRRGVDMIALASLCATPLLTALNPLSGDPSSQLRYCYYAVPALIVVTASIVRSLPSLQTGVVVLVTAAVSVSWSQLPWSVPAHRTVESAAAALQRNGGGVMLASYWDSYTIDYLCPKCARVLPFVVVRELPGDEPQPASVSYVLAGPSAPLASVTAALTAQHVSFDVIDLGVDDYALIRTAQPVPRGFFGGGLGS